MKLVNRATFLLSYAMLGFSTLTMAQAPHSPMPASDPKQQLLAQLHDVINPQGVSWWPLSLAWWIVLMLAMIAAGVLAFWLTQRNAKSRYRRRALKLLEQIPQKDSSPAHYAQQVATLLKRCFFAAYPDSRNLTAKIHGEQWAQLLTQTRGEGQNKLKLALNWSELLYTQRANAYSQQTNAEAIKQVKQFAQQWIKQHKTLSLGELNDILDNVKQTHSSNTAGAKHVSI